MAQYTVLFKLKENKRGNVKSSRGDTSITMGRIMHNCGARITNLGKLFEVPVWAANVSQVEQIFRSSNVFPKSIAVKIIDIQEV